MKKSDFVYNFPLDVRWGDADALGHVNNVQFVRFLESGRVAYCCDVLDMKFDPDMLSGWILADMQCSYIKQVHYPENLEVCTAVTKIGGKSITLTAHIYIKGDDQPVLTSKGIMVWFDYATQKTATIPDSIRQIISCYEKSVEGAVQ